MDTLDDFTIMNIIGQCDMRTAFNTMPLVCRRMYELYDDVAVARQFRAELRARIEATMAQRFSCNLPDGRMLISESWRPPIELVAKARLGDFVLNVKISAADTQIFACDVFTIDLLGDMCETLTGSRTTRRYISCELTTTFETVCLWVDETLSHSPVRIDSVVYILYNDNTFGVHYRETDGFRMLYELGFGYKYTTLEVTVHFNVSDVVCVIEDRFAKSGILSR